MNMSSNSAFLKEMGITEWTLRGAIPETVQAIASTEVSRDQVIDTPRDALAPSDSNAKVISGIWWFYGNKPQGEVNQLFQNIIRVLGLAPEEWFWKNPAEKFDPEQLPQDGTPIVALAFGGSVAQKLSGEREALPELRETVLAINADGAEDLPLIATFELSHLLGRPGDKALFWQDLLLAKSVLQNI
jgi:DNA polymerase